MDSTAHVWTDDADLREASGPRRSIGRRGFLQADQQLVRGVYQDPPERDSLIRPTGWPKTA